MKTLLFLLIATFSFGEQYRVVKDSSMIQRLSDGAFVPNDPSNRDSVEYQKWVQKGNVPLPAIVIGTVESAEQIEWKNAEIAKDNEKMLSLIGKKLGLKK